MNRYRPFVSALALAMTLSCVRSDPVAAEPVFWSCRVAAPAEAAADFCPAIGAAIEAGLLDRDPDRTVAALAPGAASDPDALNLVVELVSASKRSLSSRLLWQGAGTSDEQAGPVLTLDIADRSLFDSDLRETLASHIARTLLSHGGAPL